MHSVFLTPLFRQTLCAYIKSGNLSVLCAGHWGNQFVLITSDYQVFAVNESALSTDTLNLTNTKPVPFDQKWPSLAGNFTPSNASTFQGFTVANSGNEYLFLFQHKPLSGTKSGMKFDKQQHKSGISQITSDYQVMISSTKSLHFYAIRKNVTNGDLQMAQIKLNSVQGNDHFIETSLFHPLCASGKDELIMMKQENATCEHKLNWTDKLSGFVGQDAHFHLFGPGYVLSFPENVYTHMGTLQKMTNKTLGCFVGCDSGTACPLDLGT